MSVSWLPFESNPDTMNKFLHDAGVPKKWGISDVLILEDDYFDTIQGPILSLLLLFPCGSKVFEYGAQKESASKNQPGNDKVFHMKQTVKNACGTFALIHAVGNNAKELNLDENSILDKFLKEAKDMSPEERGRCLEQNEKISEAHEASAQEGQTEAPAPYEESNFHFIAFVNIGGQLYELDGRKSCPISYGATSKETFAKDAAKVCKSYLAMDPDSLNFSVLSLGPM